MSTIGFKNRFGNGIFVRMFYKSTQGHVPINCSISLLTKSLLSLESNESMTLVHDNALLVADGRSRHGCQHAAAAAADCGQSSCRSADTQHADHRPAAHSPVCVDCRTQALRTR